MEKDPLIGQRIDERYEVVEVLGRGGFAVVYRAHQPAMERDVAIKVMAHDAMGGEEFVERFQREARIVASLEHPHILPVYDVGEHGDQVYLVMRLLEGGDLKERQEADPLSVEASIKLIGQLASALTYAHQRGIIHRDLKPQNVLIDAENNPYLTDFGIAKSLGATNQMTQTGTIMGTPTFMSPEQWRTEPVDARTDVYALGIITYLLLAGKLPFESDTPFSLMYMHLDEMPLPLDLVKLDVPKNLTEVVFKAIAKAPDDRFASAVEFGEALEAAYRDPNSTLVSRSGGGVDSFATYIESVEEHQTILEAEENQTQLGASEEDARATSEAATVSDAPYAHHDGDEKRGCGRTA